MQAAAGPLELWVEGGELALPVQESGRQTLLAEDFRLGFQRWSAWDAPAPGVFLESRDLEVGAFAGTGVELIGNAGLLVTVVSVQPGAAIEFAGSSWVPAERAAERAEGRAVGRSRAADAGFVLIELRDWPAGAAAAPARVLQQRGRVHALDGPSDAESWHENRVALRLAPDTNALVVACRLQPTRAGAVAAARFRDLELIYVPLAEHWDVALRDSAERFRAEGPSIAPLAAPRLKDEQAVLDRAAEFPARRTRSGIAQRRVLVSDLEGGGEPGLVLLPAERMTWRIRVPDWSPRLTFDVLAWDEGFLAAGDGPAPQFQVHVGELVLDPLQSGTGRGVHFALDRFVGRDVRLSLEAGGEVPVAFARPRIVRSGVAADPLGTSTDDSASFSASN